MTPAKVVIRDGIEYVAEVKGAYDVILIDAPDPEGAAVGLFSTDFYANARDALGDDGVLAAQTESPFIDPKLVKEIYDRIWAQVPLCRLYTAHVPSYSVGIWSFALALKRPEMLMISQGWRQFKTRTTIPRSTRPPSPCRSTFLSSSATKRGRDAVPPGRVICKGEPRIG